MERKSNGMHLQEFQYHRYKNINKHIANCSGKQYNK